MEKDEFMAMLQADGYKTSIADGVVMVDASGLPSNEQRRIWREVRRMASEARFASSLGIYLRQPETSEKSLSGA